MLKNIRLHLEKDEEKQALLDDQLAKSIVKNRNDSFNAFLRNIPSLLPLIKDSQLSNLSLFMNKWGETNIVDYGIGRTFYGFHPSEEIQQQVAQTLDHCPCVDFTDTKKKTNLVENSEDPLDFKQLKSFKTEQALSPMPDEVECLVVLGCGLGLHIIQLLEARTIKNLIVYEPELQYFQCSTMAVSWADIFALAKAKGTALFLQIEKDGRDLLTDIKELREHISIDSFHLYKHYNQEVFDSIYHDICHRSWDDISNSGFGISQHKSHLEFVPSWAPKLDFNAHKNVSTQNSLFEQNLLAFKKYFPNIYQQYKDYTPQIWLPFQNQNQEINVVKSVGLHPWYGSSPKQDCEWNFENFNEQPNKDGLVLGYKGTKLAHYLHYQFVNETQELLKEAEEDVGELPETIASIIMFGLGVGYQLEKLLDEHTVEKLFVCEPNPDFFYASLFAIDWQTIFEKIEASDTRIYLNVGDDGTHLFNDLLNQFHSIGPYILNNTYFYQSYYNASLNSAIAQLREQLQVVISMGEYFDHAYYGIEHMKEGFRRDYPLLMNNPSQYLNYKDKEVPVFIIGNGPSLDMSIEAIKEWREQVIVISCGTALQALYKNGITPDFHAEIEQNRSTYDWPVLIGDLGYLKKITLISCNGIHPDTCELYKDVLVAFKEGESSTVSALSVLGKQHFEVLQQSFPTVSNFVTNIISVLGFNHIYLMGVDLGFVDVNHHHSKSSGYYQEDGKETYDYSTANITSLVVPGNFRPRVNTKHEFKVSRQIIEQVTHRKPKEQTFYNCSDGARIKGTTPLEIDNLLIMASNGERDKALASLKNKAFSNKHSTHFIEKYEKQFSHNLLLEGMQQLQNLVEQEISAPEDISNLINTQKELLFDSYQSGRSLLFYYMYGTVNYVNAVLIKLKAARDLNAKSITLNCWNNILTEIQRLLTVLQKNFDTSKFNDTKRELLEINERCKGKKIRIHSDSNELIASIKYLINTNFRGLSLLSNDRDNQNTEADFVLLDTDFIEEGTLNTLIINRNREYPRRLKNSFVSLMIPKDDKANIVFDEFIVASHAMRGLLSYRDDTIIYPKYRIKDVNEPINPPPIHLTSDSVLLNLREEFVLITKGGSAVMKNGTRGQVLTTIPSCKDYIYAVDTQLLQEKRYFAVQKWLNI
ncbi:6-hydroxymethylpterin diphosphokinase MptE-like protein [Paraglaciecola chathamensis]|uniref:6-hydroxymethylpterin diphosphokinase MptE-like protein n=1 Tax=Paraglaciecola chathamensis TaxID=368405 RepID=UPI002090CCB5|nr:6-hydroxymethylpterin diphosphokinase MptE-like protein [Paraglaciecola agarilytica]